MSKLIILIIIIIISLGVILNFLYNEGVKLNGSGKEYCEDYPKNSIYKCPYGNKICQSDSFFHIIICPLNKALYDSKLSKTFNWKTAFENPKLFYNPVYYLLKKEEVKYQLNYRNNFSKVKINVNGTEQEIYINNSETIDNITHVIKKVEDLDNKKEYLAVSYKLLIDFLIELSDFKEKMSYNEFRQKIHSLKNDIKDEIKTSERISNDLKTKIIFFDFPNGISNIINVIQSSLLPKLTDKLLFNYKSILQEKILTNYQLSLFEYVMYTAYEIQDLQIDKNLQELKIILKEYFF